MRFWSALVQATGLLACLALTGAASAQEQCSDCQNGQQYCGIYDTATQTWTSGAYQACNTQPPPPPPPPNCHDQPGTTSFNNSYTSSTYCRAVVPGSNECIARGSATVLIDVLTCVYNQFDGCGTFTGTYTQSCGTKYDSCGC